MRTKECTEHFMQTVEMKSSLTKIEQDSFGTIFLYKGVRGL